MRLLLPKALSEQARWSEALVKAKVTVVFCNPVDVERLPITAVIKTLWMNLDRYSAIICVSPTAAQVIVDALDQYWPMIPTGIRWLCNGPRTASVLKQAGVQPIYPISGHTAEDVLALTQAEVKPMEYWLIVKGEDGRSFYESELTKQGAQVEMVETYKRLVSEDKLAGMQSMAEQCDALWLSSTHLGQQIIDSAPEFWRNWPGQWWVSSGRLAQWATDHGIDNIRVANGATTESLLQLIAQQGTAQ